MFGEDRHRYAGPGDIQALAGTCPITIESSKKRSVQFRLACNREFRYTAQQLAATSVRNPIGPLPITVRLWREGIRSTVRCVAWPIAGWSFFGPSGSGMTVMMKPVTYGMYNGTAVNLAAY